LSLLFPGDGELANLMRQTDWAQTTLGPVGSWPNALKTAVRIVLTSRFSMWMAWGPDLAFLYNDAYRRDTLGVKHPRALGAKTHELWSEIWQDISPRIMRVLSTGHATWDEDLLLLLERNGYREETYHTFSYSPLHDDVGQVRGVLSVVTETTARVISERRVALLGKLGGALATVNTAEGVIQAVTQTLKTESRALPFSATYLFDEAKQCFALASKTGFGASGMQPPNELVAGSHPWAARDALDDGKVVEVELAGEPWPTGPWPTSPTRVLVVPLAGRGGARVTGVFVAALNPYRPLDASYREFIGLFAGQLGSALANAHTYEQERKRAESLAELDRAKTAFFSNVSHEFRTPLTLMLGPLRDLLDDSQIPDQARGELEIVHRNGLRLLKLVNTMLDFSRIEAGRAAAHFQPLDLGALTADLASVFRAATDRAGIKLVVDCERFEDLVEVDPDMWEKIVLNLVSNAFKFTLSGSIEVTLSRHAGVARLCVRDTGIGIPPNEVAHVFDRFHRVEGSRGRTQEGTGIGLALVQELVRLHHGTITVKSEVDRGTTFTVEIPLRTRGRNDGEVRTLTGRREPNAYLAEAIRWLPDQPEPAAPDSLLARNRVLVADDNADMRTYMERLLGSRWHVETVSNGREALARIRDKVPDLIITDVMMPELDGFGLLAAVRGRPETASLPVIMLSARAGEEARVEGLQAGANDYLVKPFTSRELIARVDSLLLQAAERNAEERHARQLATIFEQAPVAMTVLRGPNHVFQIANARYREVVGHREVLGKSVAEALPEVVAQGMVAILDEVFRTQVPFVASSIPIHLTDPIDGKLGERIFDLVYHPMIDNEGNSTGIAAIGHDVTEITLARREAEAANRSKDEFLAMLGHELRNPLAPIITALELLGARPDVGGSRERAVIERQVKHVVNLVDDLLDVSRITRGKIELRPSRVSIADVLARSIEQASPLFEQQRHELNVEVPSDLYVYADPARLAQVMSNLLTNAAKYTQQHGRIEVRARRTGSTVTIDVKDNGVGIEPTFIDGIFEPFAQARQSIDRARGGLGLGLAIVSSLVKLHKGTVCATSPGAGKGSTFTVELPIDDGQSTHAPETPQAANSSRERYARVLVVDDNIDAAILLVDILEARGYAAVAAHDGPSALKMMESFNPEIAVLDLGLPVMDGFELARAIRDDKRFASTRLVALTGYGQAQDRKRTADAGFAAHFVKPVDNVALHTQLQALLKQ
jgi:signal transduction histidine kinase/DNA-binding response OmpR family regulator